MSPPISQPKFNKSLKKAIAAGHEDRTLRISKHTGKVTTARHGFFSRTVRRLFGPTRQDIEDNRRILKIFREDLKEEYGARVADSALLRARNRPADSALDHRKPLTVRQARQAREIAEQSIQARENELKSLDGKIETAGADAYRQHLTQGLPRAELVRLRVLEELHFAAARERGLSDHSRELVEERAAKQAIAQSRDGAESTVQRIHDIRATATKVVRAIAGTGGDRDGPIALLSELSRQSKALAPAYREHPYEVGPEYRAKPARRATIEALVQLEPHEARRLFKRGMRAGSRVRQIYATIEHGRNRIGEGPGSQPWLNAGEELRDQLRFVLESLAARAGIPEDEANDQVDALEREVEGEIGQDGWIDRAPLMSHDFDKHVRSREAPHGIFENAVSDGLRRFRSRADVDRLSNDRKAVAHARVEDALRMSGPQDRAQIEVMLATIVRQVARMPERQIAAELSGIASLRPSVDPSGGGRHA